jgi:hypothetical protein
MAQIRQGHRKAWKIALWTLAIPPALCVILLLALTIAGWWVERVYLQKDIHFVTTKSVEGVDGAEDSYSADTSLVRFHGARFNWWKLNVAADSLSFRSSSFDAHTNKASVRIDWIGGITALRPAARLDVDSLWMRLYGDTKVPEKKPLDSLAFPEISLPLAVRLVVRGLRVDDDSSKTLGFVARARGVTVRSRGGQRVQARIGRAETRWTSDLVFASTATLDWSDADSVAVHADVQHAKRPLWKGHDSLSADVRDAAPYYKAFGIEGNVPDLRGVRLRASASLGDSVSLTLRLGGAMGAWRVNPDFALGPQAVDLSADWSHDRGTVKFTSDGAQGEDIRLTVDTRLLKPPPSLGTLGASTGAPPSGRKAAAPTPLWQQAAVTVRGHAHGLSVKVRDTLRTADVTIDKATWDGRNLVLALVTGDSSRVEASALLAGSPRARHGSFRATVQPDDRWVKVFLGNTVTFTALNVRGDYRTVNGNEIVTATVAARALTSYGFALDSVRTHHAYSITTGLYTVKPSLLYAGKDVWTLSGTLKPAPAGARPGRDGIDLDATLAGAGRGTLRYTLAPDGTMEGTATAFEATALPYAPLDSMPLRDAVLDGTFLWNPERKTGHTDLRARGMYANTHANGSGKAESVEARLTGEWTPQRLTLREATVSYRGSDLTARARLRMEGRQFYEAGTVPPDHYEYAAVENGRFNLADILAAFLPEPPLEKGILRGGLAFSDTAGFAGSLALEEVVLRDPPGDLVIRELRVAGQGDKLVAFGRTESPVFPLLNDTLRMTLTGARADTQRVVIDLTADKNLRLRLEGVMHRFDGLRGSVMAQGSARFPEGSGALEDLDVAMTFDVPFSGGMGAAMLKTATFTGAYANAGQPRQRFSLDPELQGGTLKVTRLRIENDQDQALTGSMEYNPAKNLLNVKVDGARFAVQWTDDYRADLRDLHLEYRLGPEGARARASFSSGTFLYADLPLKVEGRLTALRADYTSPPPPASGKRADRAADTLRITGVLQESEVRHRLRNLGDIQRLIRRNERRRPGAGAPLFLDVKMRTLGNRNTVTSDIIRLTWVGDFAMRGVHPYTLLEGRVNTLNGDFGLKREAYDIRRLDVKWLNAPLEEGEIHMEARKSLARSCTPQSSGTTDSCTVITRLDGTLSEMQFSYDSDCGGAFGAGANVAAILYSVQRGCYDASIAAGDGRGYGERALTLLEPTISRSLSQVVGRFSGAWIETAEITGLGSLSADGADSDTLGEALSLALTSREYLRLRLKIRSGYHTASQDLSNPWEHMLAIEWRPPLPPSLRDSLWRQRLRDNLRVAASVQTRPVRNSNPEADEIEKKIDLHYNHVFWGEWWAKKKKVMSAE